MLLTAALLLLSAAGAGAQAPAVTAVSPAANVRNAPASGPVTVTFDRALNAASAGALRVYSSQAGGLRTRGATPAQVSGSTLSYAPAPAFKPGETVQYTVTTGAQSAAGTALPRPRVGQFTVAAGAAGQGNFAAVAPVNVVAGGSPSVEALGDVDGDGDLDLAESNYGSNTVTIHLNNGRGGFGAGTPVPVGPYPGTVVLGDIDGDGDLDLLVTITYVNAPDAVSVWLNGGDASGSNTGTFSNSRSVGVGDNPTGLALGDLDGDGDLDLATSNAAGNTASVRFNDGQGTFGGGSEVGVGPYPSSVALGDIDGDGDLDLLTTDTQSNRYVSVRLNGGDATGSSTGTFSNGSSVRVGVFPIGLALGDLDGDGDLDLVAGNLASSDVSICLNDGTGTLQETSYVSTGSQTRPRLMALGDVDGDGDLDLAVADYDSDGGVYVLLNSGTATFTLASALSAGRITSSVALADIDGDQDLDLIASNYNENFVTVRLNGAPIAVPAPTITGFAPASGPVGTVVTVTGANLTGANLTGATALTLNGAAVAAYTIVSATSLTFTVPAGASSGLVAVTTPGGTATGATPFTVTVPNPVPTISGLAPATAVAGSAAFTLTVNGTNFVAASGVSFNNVALPTTFVSATQLTAAVPASAVVAAGSYPVTVVNPAPGGGTSAPATFTVTAAAPAITGFAPASGPVGTVVTVTGTNLTGATALTLNGAAVAGYTVVSATSLTFTVPAGASSGLIAVTTPGGTATSAARFTVTVVSAAVGGGLPGLRVYPNPARRQLTVALPAAGAATVALRDLAGRLVLAPAALVPDQQLRLPAHLAAGMYLLVVRQGERTAVRRLELE